MNQADLVLLAKQKQQKDFHERAEEELFGQGCGHHYLHCKFQ